MQRNMIIHGAPGTRKDDFANSLRDLLRETVGSLLDIQGVEFARMDTERSVEFVIVRNIYDNIQLERCIAVGSALKQQGSVAIVYVCTYGIHPEEFPHINCHEINY